MLKIAVIGSGQIARVSHISHYQSIEGVEVAAVCDVNIQAAKSTAKMFGIPQYYTDHIKILEEVKPDAVSICVPNRFHCRITCDALSRGCHVLCEKPPAITIEEADKMQETAQKYGKILTFGFHFRYGDRIRLLKEKIENGEFGEIYAGQVQWLRRRGIPGWGNFTNKEMQGGGALIDIGVHMLDLALYLMDYPKLNYVCASASSRIGKQGGTSLLGEWDGGSFTVEDGLFGFIHFADGRSLQVGASFALHTGEKERRNVELYGDRKGCSVFPLEIYADDQGNPVNTVYPFEETKDWHYDCISNFIQSIQNETQPLVTAEQAVYLQKVTAALYESAETGKPVMMGK